MSSDLLHSGSDTYLNIHLDRKLILFLFWNLRSNNLMIGLKDMIAQTWGGIESSLIY
jgi:hypothetical protein